MSRFSARRRRAFTLVELLVVISIIGLLVGLLMPAIINARKQANIAVCQNNMKQLALAMMNYESRKAEYPGYLNVLVLNNGQVYTDPDTGQKKGVSFVVPLLDDLGRSELLRTWRTPVNKNQQSFNDPRVTLDLLMCVEDLPTAHGGTQLNYVVNSGMADVPATGGMPKDWPENGVFFDHYTGDRRVAAPAQGGGGAGIQTATPIVYSTSSYIARNDGLTQTMMISENVDAGNYTDTSEGKLGFVWNGSGTVNVNTSPPTVNPPDDNMRINRGIGDSEFTQPNNQTTNATNSNSQSSSSMVYARPSSNHPGGVNVFFCDGHGKFLSQDIDYYVYCLLMTPNGKRVRMPGTTTVLKNFDRSLDDSWLK